MKRKSLSVLFLLLSLALVFSVVSCSKEGKENDIRFRYVDLGLPSGTKWAIANIGASKPEEAGYYYMWGDLSNVTSTVSWNTYKHCNGTKQSLKKYIVASTYGDFGTPDNKMVLEPQDDIASVELGGKWRMPTVEDYQELVDQCQWEWTKVNGVIGKKATGPSGKSIFFPAAGTINDAGMLLYNSYGSLWSSSLVPDDPTKAYYFEFRENSQNYSSFERIFGRNVRAVFR